MSDTKIESTFADGLEADLDDVLKTDPEVFVPRPMPQTDAAIAGIAHQLKHDAGPFPGADHPRQTSWEAGQKRRAQQMTAPVEEKLGPAVGQPRGDLEAFMSAGENMLLIQQEKISKLRSAYEIERAVLADNYRSKIEALQREGAEALRNMDIGHEAQMFEANKLVDVILAMRDVSRITRQ
jgi:hypothetical protein